MTSARYDLAIVGSGFAGSLLAMIARRLGLSVALIEKGKHPRVVIGESSTPLSNLILEELSERYNLPRIRPLSKWGTWQREYPHIACGLKRGFTFYHHSLDGESNPGASRDKQLLVAASPHDEISDTHWYRADFDHFLVQEARRMGVEYADETVLRSVSESADEVALEGPGTRFRARWVVDATGPRGFLFRALQLEEAPVTGFPATQALYSHFSGVARLESLAEFRSDEAPPYPVDDAAVHHVFDGGWAWVLQFNNGSASAGVASTSKIADRLQLAEGAAAWERLLDRIPALRKQFAAARAERPFVHLPRLSFRSRTVVGARWALLPSAAGFVDPLLSTGFPLTLLGVARLAEILEAGWSAERLANYAAQTERELLATARLLGGLYRSMGDFEEFTALSLLYFAAASYSETARRLGKPHLAASFLLCDSSFGEGCRELLGRPHTREEIGKLIEPIDVAGLTKAGRRNWYPVEARDLLDSAAKLEATKEDMARLLERCGLAAHR
ncbi:MAG TPA: FAD-dependent oxidoreductase [Bryobacteraceae bacterium]|nr:FAD-dependent oxidoreductase [Bryobacteraceae bacterium]